MRTLYVIFTHGTSIFSKAIEVFEEAGEFIQGDNGVEFLPTHVGLAEQGKFQEALASGFVGQKLSRYQPENVRVYKLEVSDESLVAAGDQAFNSILGRDYSPRALLCGAAYSLFGVVLDNPENEGDCSEDVTDILRAYGFPIDGTVESSSITPNILIGIVAQIAQEVTFEEVLASVGEN